MKTEAATANMQTESGSGNIDLLRPLLPATTDILPYLERIDSTRWYSNFGPLVMELHDRFGRHFGLDATQCVTAASGTAGIISTLRAMNLPRDSYCLMPAWTFVGTPATAIAAEMIPYFVDVDNDNWALEPDYVRQVVRDIKGVIGAVVVVAPFGKIVDIAAWDRFSADTSIPVVIDAAAGFDWFSGAEFGKTPVVISLHATKVLGAGEGGIVLSRDQALIRHVQEQTNFGFYTRHISTPGINCKMSEYAAAVAHASLDIWEERRRQWQQTTRRYIESLAPLAAKYGISVWLDDDKVVSTCNVRLADNIADEVISQLRARGIRARQWWGKGCHQQPAYAKYPKAELPITSALGASLVSLPFYIDMTERSIEIIASELSEILSK